MAHPLAEGQASGHCEHWKRRALLSWSAEQPNTKRHTIGWSTRNHWMMTLRGATLALLNQARGASLTPLRGATVTPLILPGAPHSPSRGATLAP